MRVLRELSVDVVTASRQRIVNVFDNGLPVYLSFSGGKDSLVLAHLVVELGRKGAIDLRRLRVEFIDEEAIFHCVETIVKEWREKFLLLGAEFRWYCLEVKHFSCLNQLENDESFICWDRFASDKWVRSPPSFAIRSHPLLRSRVDTYQQFLERINDGVHITGVRIYESMQRRSAISCKFGSYTRTKTEPIYDWKDSDVWLYLKEHDIKIPDAYIYMYQIGIENSRLRISQFFSIDTAHTLSRMAEFYPNLMDDILRREPNAYIVSLYWDSEMFRRRSRKRRTLDDDSEIDYKDEVLRLLSNIPENFNSKGLRKSAEYVKRLLIRCSGHLDETAYRKAYDILIAGDPKNRSIRALQSSIFQRSARSLEACKVGTIRAS